MIPSRIVPLAAIWAVAFILGPAAAETPTEGKIDESKQMVELLKKIEQRLAGVEARSDVALDLINKDIKQLREEIGRLEKEVAELRRAAPGNSTSNYPATPPVTTPVAPLAQMARVRLVNNFFTDMTAVVNGRTFIVPANQMQDVLVPAGTMTFLVPQVGWPTQVRTLAVNERLTLTMGPI
jgi:hypothetical protein